MIKVTDSDTSVEVLIYENEFSIYEGESKDVVFSRTESGKLVINGMKVSGKVELLLINYLQKNF